MANVSKNYFTFVKGLITEASALAFPENASLDEENFVLNRDGSRQRRKGMDYEGDYSLSAAIADNNFSSGSVTCHRWNNVGNSGSTTFTVVQVGATLYFYDSSSSSDSISSGLKSFTVDLDTFATSWVTSAYNEPVQTAIGNGALFVVSKAIEPFYIEYDPVADTISTQSISIKIRDFWGVDDSLSIEEKIATLSNLHEYNLLNQGWTQTNISAYRTSTGTYPANNQIMLYGKDSTSSFTAALLDKQYFGDSSAPKGNFKLDLFARDRTGKGTLGAGAEPSIEYEKSRPSTTAFYAGRVFYSGIDSNKTGGPILNGYIFFSRALLDNTNAGDCFQVNNPTSEAISDLLPTDGGYVHIPEAGKIVKLEVIENSLIVFATNGVWRIWGTNDYGFAADGYQRTKVTDVGTDNAYTVVNVEDGIFYWSEGGIYTLQFNPQGKLVATNISENTIQTEYNNIGKIAQKNATGVYDKPAKKVRWLYNNTSSFTGSSYLDKYNGELVLDLVLGAFYKNSIVDLTTNSPYVAGYTITNGVFQTTSSEEVIASGTTVVVGTDTVIANIPYTTNQSTSIKYLCVVPQGNNTSKITFSYYKDTDFVDWKQADTVGSNFISYLDTGYDILQNMDRNMPTGDSARRKQTPYVVVHFNRTEDGFELDTNGNITYSNPSGCYMRSKWGWSNSATSGRWSPSQQVYRLKRNYIPDDVNDSFDYGLTVISTKNRVRGHGQALSLHFESEDGKDMHLLGWQVFPTMSRDV